MLHEERIRVCEVCRNRAFDATQGIVCGLTGARPSFEGGCPDYDEDASRIRKREAGGRTVAPRYTSEQRRRFLLLTVPVIIALAVVIGFLHYIRAESLRQKRSEEYKRFAVMIVEQLERGNSAALDNSIHFGSLLSKASQRFDIKPGVWHRSVLDQMRLGWYLVRELRDGNRIELIDVREEGDKAFALFRILGNTLDHIELTLDHQSDRVWVVDLFRYSTGVLLSDAVMEPELMRRRFGWNLVQQIYRERALSQRLFLGYSDEVWVEINGMDPVARTSMFMRHLYLQLAGADGDSALVVALREIEETQACDPRFVAYTELLISQLAGDGPTALAALKDLQPSLGRDPWMGVLTARAHLAAGDSLLCLNALNEALAGAPFDENLHFERLQILAEWGRYDAALQQADTMILILGYSPSELAGFLDSIPGIDTSQALYDWR